MARSEANLHPSVKSHRHTWALRCDKPQASHKTRVPRGWFKARNNTARVRRFWGAGWRSHWGALGGGTGASWAGALRVLSLAGSKVRESCEAGWEDGGLPAPGPFNSPPAQRLPSAALSPGQGRRWRSQSGAPGCAAALWGWTRPTPILLPRPGWCDLEIFLPASHRDLFLEL